jgi:DNA-binding NarL/FixJ family response regulator
MPAKLHTTHSLQTGYDEPIAIPDSERKQVETFMEPAYKILIADDHPLFREAISSVIASGFEGSEILETDDLDSALIIAKENDDRDLILLDLNMPGMNGLNGLIILRNEAPTIPVVIVSAEEEKQVVLQAIT